MLYLKPSKLALELKESGKYPPNTKFYDIRRNNGKGQFIATDSNVVFIVHDTYMIELEIDPNNPKTINEKYILFSTDDNKTFYQELTIKDNLKLYSNKLLLEFIDIDKKLNYSLKIVSNTEEEEYFVFKNIPYKDLVK